MRETFLIGEQETVPLGRGNLLEAAQQQCPRAEHFAGRERILRLQARLERTHFAQGHRRTRGALQVDRAVTRHGDEPGEWTAADRVELPRPLPHADEYIL